MKKSKFQQNRNQLKIIIRKLFRSSVFLFLVLFTNVFLTPAVSLSEGDATPPSTEEGRRTDVDDRKKAMHEWFAKYDQIRRNAEMNLSEKFQVKTFLDKNIQPGSTLKTRDLQLATKMREKYGAAVHALKNLAPEPESKKLQDGYLEYFTRVHELFKDFIVNQDATSNEKKSIGEFRSQLETLDKENRQLDDELRKRFSIPKHKHS